MKISVTKQLMRLLVLAACVAGSNSVHALLIDIIGDKTSVRIVDGSPGDALSGTGVVSTSALVDDFFVLATVGKSKPQIGSAAIPEIELTSVEVNGSDGSIRLVVYDDGFSALGTPSWDFTLDGEIGSFLSSIEGSSVSVSAYIDVNNNYTFGGIETSEFLAALAGTGPIFDEGAFDLKFGNQLIGPYGLAIVADITHSGLFQISAFNAALRDPPPVPEPTIIVMMGLGLAGLGFAGRRRRDHKPKGIKT